MQAQLKALLLSFSLITLIGGVVFTSMGPGLLELAFFDDDRSKAILVFDFHNSQTYGQLLADESEQWERRGQGSYRLGEVLEGSVGDEWPRLDIGRYSEGRSVVQFVTSSRYREVIQLDDGFLSLKIGSRALMDGDFPSVMVPFFVEEVHAHANSLAGIVKLGEEHLVWQGPVRVIEHEAGWQQGFVLGFKTPSDAIVFLTRHDVRAERDIIRSQTRTLFVAVFVRD